MALSTLCQTLAGGVEVVSLSFLVPSLSSTLFPEEDPAVADQFLKGETMTVHQVEAVVQLVHCHCLPLEEMIRRGWGRGRGPGRRG